MQMRNPKEVEKEQYHEFYKKTFNDFLEPLSCTHFTTEVSIFLEYSLVIYNCYKIGLLVLLVQFLVSVILWFQGEVEFRSVLFIPGMGPLSNEDIVSPKTKNIRLYVKRVFISDDFDGELVHLEIMH